MRTFSLVFFLTVAASLSPAASFNNGQAARAVIGQNAFTDGQVAPAVNSAQTAANNVLGGASGLFWYNGRLFVADDNRLGAYPDNNRVVVFNTAQIAGIHDDLTNITTPSPRCHLCGYGAVGVIGQADYTGTNPGRDAAPTSAGGSLYHPVSVATDGHYFAIADSDNNRVLLWNNVPQSPTTPADIVLGQTNFTSLQTPQPVNANSLRGPQAVWIQNGKLFVADTGNYRVLVWNTIPTQNNQPASFALGQTDLNSAFHPAGDNPATNAGQLNNPSAVSSDGTHLFIADTGFNRVLIWNTIPSANGQPADVVIGQPDMTTSVSDNATKVCASPTNDSSGNPQYPFRCEATLSFPRAVIAGGGKLYIADSGNDRVLVFNSIPTANAAKADNVLGQPDFVNNIVTNVSNSLASTTIDNTASVDTLQSPTSLAFDGSNLYVADPFNRRVAVFTPGDTPLPGNSVLNWASEIIRQEGEVVFSGTVVAADTATVTINSTGYTYTIKANDTLDIIAQGLVTAINTGSGDPNATAIFAGTGSGGLYLSSKASNLNFDSITLAASVSNPANLVPTTSGGYLTSGTAATGTPGMLVEINAAPGTTFADSSATSPMPQATSSLPTSLAGVQVYVDGIPAPIVRVSPTQIIVQLRYALSDRSSASVYVRTQRSDGSITSTVATPVYIAPANPGLFNAQAYANQPRPWPAQGALHQLGNPSVVVSIDGTVKAGDIATVTVAGAVYNYTVVATDTLFSIAQNLVNAINNANDANVTASIGGAFTRVVVTARQPNAAGTGISVAGTSVGAANAAASVTVTAYSTATCCNVPQGQPLSTVSPALPNETIVLLGTGLGSLVAADAIGTPISLIDNTAYQGPQPNTAAQSVSATMNNVTAQIVSAGLPQFSFGIYYVQMIVPTSLTASPTTSVYIAQNAFISNTVTIPVGTAGQNVTPPTPVTPPATALPSPINLIAQVLVSPANLVFAIQGADNANLGSQSVTVQNPSGGNLTINSISLSGNNASDFQLTNSCPGVLGAGSSCTVSISYSPGGGSPHGKPDRQHERCQFSSNCSARRHGHQWVRNRQPAHG